MDGKLLNELTKEDSLLFSDMREKYVSNNEKIFFETIKYKQQYETAMSNELLIYEGENVDKIYLLRKYFETYLIGWVKNDGSANKYEVDCLAQLLELNLAETIGFARNITCLQWLREQDYQCVKYNRNRDFD